jgi:hypothetical protein
MCPAIIEGAVKELSSNLDPLLANGTIYDSQEENQNCTRKNSIFFPFLPDDRQFSIEQQENEMIMSSLPTSSCAQHLYWEVPSLLSLPPFCESHFAVLSSYQGTHPNCPIHTKKAMIVVLSQLSWALFITHCIDKIICLPSVNNQSKHVLG